MACTAVYLSNHYRELSYDYILISLQFTCNRIQVLGFCVTTYHPEISYIRYNAPYYIIPRHKEMGFCHISRHFHTWFMIKVFPYMSLCSGETMRTRELVQKNPRAAQLRVDSFALILAAE